MTQVRFLCLACVNVRRPTAINMPCMYIYRVYNYNVNDEADYWAEEDAHGDGM